MYHALIEARVPFELVHEAFLTPDRLDHFKLLILADAAALSDAQCAAIRAYVDRGGSVLATFATSLFDETGQRRPDFGLADLFGVSFTGRIDGPMQNSYLSLDDAKHPVTAGFGDTTRIINGVYRIEVTAKAGVTFPSPLTLIPSYPDLPMEDVFPRVAHTDTREIYLREMTNAKHSRVVYIPWDIDRTFWDVLSVDHGRLLHNAIAWATNEPAPVEVDGPGVIDVTVWRQRDSMTVHLVNLSNPMLMKGPLREVIPIGPQKVRIRLPAGTHAKQVQLLTLGKPLIIDNEGGNTLTLTVPSIDVHEVIAIDL
jgi:hypothetical protein